MQKSMTCMLACHRNSRQPNNRNRRDYDSFVNFTKLGLLSKKPRSMMDQS
jgi:hypothetical protein